MKFDAFLGGSYKSQAYTADEERTVNWYPEQLQSAGATSKTALYPTPGVERIDAAIRNGNGRAHYFINGREFAVIGTEFYEIDVAGAVTSRGTIALDENPATLSSNGDGGGEILITAGGNAYIFTLATNGFTQIAALDGLASFGGSLDGYFLVLDVNTSTLYVSELLDGLTWNVGSNFAQRNLSPDRWKAMKIIGRFIWLFGEVTSECWYDVGATFPFAPHPSGVIPYGIAAPWSACIVGSDVVWLSTTSSGRLSVMRATGFTPEVISDYPFEAALEQFSSVSTAVADTYSDQGHTFYLISFDKDDSTWAWDVETSLWCERGTWISNENRYVSWRPRYYSRAFGEHRMLDASGGGIYRMGPQYLTDVDGLRIRRLRRTPAIMDENKRVFYSSLELDMEVGLGARLANEGVDAPFNIKKGGYSHYGGPDWVTNSAEGGRGSGLDEPNRLSLGLDGTVLTGLYDYWNLDETGGVRAASTLSSDGTSLTPDNAKFDSAVAGKFGRAVYSPATIDGYAYSGTFGFPNPGMATGLTVAFWFRWPTAPAGAANTIMDLGTTGVEFPSIHIYRYYDSNYIDVEFRWAAGQSILLPATKLGDFAVDIWHFFILTYDPATGNLTARVNDGCLVGDPIWISYPGSGWPADHLQSTVPPASLAAANAVTFDQVRVLKAFNVNFKNFKGSVDAPMIWTRVLTDAEIQQLWLGIHATDDPQVMLRFSNDGGKTWVNQPWRSAGNVGEHFRRVRWNRLGMARRRVFEVSVTDTTPWRLTGCYLGISKSTEQAGRG